MTARHAADKLPVYSGSDGRAYLACDDAVALLRAIAETCRNLADDPDCDLHGAGTAIDTEADALACRAIEHTT
ncbi:hypothetical protein ACIP6X_02295 [Streptomyces coeruleorubidus]|uniref:hypothetical protein n=1 Tax=Streptomyces coeruleorubidus TaxID=116188 RepID=UPI0037FF40F5